MEGSRQKELGPELGEPENAGLGVAGEAKALHYNILTSKCGR